MTTRHGYGPSRLPMQESDGGTEYREIREEYDHHIRRVQATVLRHIIIPRMGRDHAPLEIWMSSSEGVLLNRGCFLGSLWDFEQAVKDSYGGSYIEDGVTTVVYGPQGVEYMAIIDMLYAINKYTARTPQERCCGDCDIKVATAEQAKREAQAVG